MIEQKTHSRLEITNVDFEIKGRYLYVSYTDGRDNEVQDSILLGRLYNWMYSELGIEYGECRKYAQYFLTTEHIKRFIQDSKTIQL